MLSQQRNNGAELEALPPGLLANCRFRHPRGFHENSDHTDIALLDENSLHLHTMYSYIRNMKGLYIPAKVIYLPTKRVLHSHVLVI
ncbi:hypothetical protein Pmar_PMAR000090 [Perkinsus marinus ATCC 50983]|uniref:Uncharacterized protein n=1 Tax=Perkinsus marinus (strain ATCC 50983 / TXsc) TaxID=423536 RepID=C5KPV6_PERM5|nr:hypothetical protein Pmar_PMAR000090 [Perkinsus marinus ATCC 50983]EER13503.1 hypothetical protein Pmar_PMAR000090 [Perkinsus marinus ATCC 50983]|eukprot:XP_002781708.1 hypothetical protein Pmar_PMAR000090 [Perkinsus marinus ATCC 50983]